LTSARRPSVRPRLEALEDRTVPAGDAVLRWNAVALDAVKLDHAIGGPHSQAGPTLSSRALAIVHAAIYDAVNSITGDYAPYKVQVAAAPGASIDAAAAQAAHDTLVALYPTMQAMFDADLAADLGHHPSTSEKRGAAVGQAVAAQILALRQNDGAGLKPPYNPGTQPGQWRPDPLHPDQMAFGTDYGMVTPFAINDTAAFLVPPPPALTSAEYTAAFNEVKVVGAADAETADRDHNGQPDRTPEQTVIGLFWGYDGTPGLGTPPVLYNQIAETIAVQQHNSESENARFFALINLAMADAGIVCWDGKYTSNFWRPITAIREADPGLTNPGDGNPDTVGDPNWRPLGAPADNGSGTNFTPPFPAYASGHATFGAALFRIMADFYGTDHISFTVHSDEFNGVTVDQNGKVRPVVTRHFDSFSAAAEENGQSRIYLGIHWAFDKTAGIHCGDDIADYVFAHTLQAVCAPHGRGHAAGDNSTGGGSGGGGGGAALTSAPAFNAGGQHSTADVPAWIATGNQGASGRSAVFDPGFLGGVFVGGAG
jgi:hypothetical protein